MAGYEPQMLIHQPMHHLLEVMLLLVMSYNKWCTPLYGNTQSEEWCRIGLELLTLKRKENSLEVRSGLG
jgi:hypothetical protein